VSRTCYSYRAGALRRIADSDRELPGRAPKCACVRQRKTPRAQNVKFWYNASKIPDAVENKEGQSLVIAGGQPRGRDGAYGAYTNFLQKLTKPFARAGTERVLQCNYRRSANGDARQAVTELYYTVHATDWLNLRPNIQYVDQPGGIKQTDDSILGLKTTLRF